MGDVFYTTIELPPDDEEAEVAAHYSYVPFSLGAYELGGLQLEPDEPAHLEDLWVEGPDGREIEVTERERERIVEEIFEEVYDRSIPPEFD